MGSSRDAISKIFGSLRTWGSSLFQGSFFASWRFFALTAVVLVGAVSLGHQALAIDDVAKTVAVLFGNVCQFILTFEGLVLLAVVNHVLVPVAQYNNFINSSAVQTGWFIVRDVVNMFYVLILLLIAFGTILGMEKYHYSKTLPTLIISAIVVNFSRTICGLIIDLSQVVMLTFVNGFSLAAGGNFAKAFKIDAMLSYQDQLNPSSTEPYAVIAGLLLAMALIAFAIVIVLYISVLLVMRIVYLWILIILSPIAFFTRAIPTGVGAGYYGQWWEEFIKKNISGPVLAFFLWLSLLVVANDGLKDEFPKAGSAIDTPAVTIPTKVFQPENLQAFIVAICLLYAGTVVAQKYGNPKIGQVTGAATGAAKKGIRTARAVARTTGRAASAVGNTGLGTKAQMAGYNALGLVPGSIGRAGRDRVASLKMREAKRGSQHASTMSVLSNDQLDRETRSWKPNALKSNEEKAREKQARIEKTKRQVAGKMEAKDFHQNRRALQELGDEFHDPTVKTVLDSAYAKRPDLILDPDEKDEKKREEQREALVKSASRMGVGQINDMDASGMTESVMMHVSPTAVAKAMASGKLNAAQEKALKGMGLSDDVEENTIARVKMLNKNAGDLPKRMRESLAVEQVKSAQKFPPGSKGRAEFARNALDAMSAGRKIDDKSMLTTLAAANMGAELAREMTMPSASGKKDKDNNDIPLDKIQVDGAALGANAQLAEQVAAALDASKIGTLAADVKQGLSEALVKQAQGGANAEGVKKALAAGVSADRIFDGNSESGRANLDSYMRQATPPQKLQLLGSMSGDAIAANGGMNGFARTAMSHITNNDMAALYRYGKKDQVRAYMQASQGIVESKKGKYDAEAGQAAEVYSYQQSGALGAAIRNTKFKVPNPAKFIESGGGLNNALAGAAERVQSGVTKVAGEAGRAISDAQKRAVAEIKKEGEKISQQPGRISRKIKRKIGRV